MKKKVFTLIVAAALVVFVNNIVSATGYPPKVNLPFTFSQSNTSGSIDIDGDGDGDFYIIYQGLLGGYNFKIYGVLSTGFLMAEYIAPTATTATDSSQPLAIALSHYTSTLSYGTEIQFTGVASPLAATETVIGQFWTDYAYIINRETGLPPITPLDTTAQEGELDGYIGVNFETVLGHYNGWLHVVVDPVSPMVTILSAGMGALPMEPVSAGLGDPYASTVPVPLIATIFGMVAIGSGVFIRRRRKK